MASRGESRPEEGGCAGGGAGGGTGGGSITTASPSFLEFITSERVKVAAMVALALALCNVDRVVMSVAIVPLSEIYGWSTSFSGFVQVIVISSSLVSFFWPHLCYDLLGIYNAGTVDHEFIMKF